MITMCNRYAAVFKATLVSGPMWADRPLNQLAAEQKVHLNQSREWRRLAPDSVPSLFEGSTRSRKSCVYLCP
jgi:hypothetical protein